MSDTEPSPVIALSSSFVDGLRSYHRSQTFLTESQIATFEASVSVENLEAGPSDIASDDIDDGSDDADDHDASDLMWDLEVDEPIRRVRSTVEDPTAFVSTLQTPTKQGHESLHSKSLLGVRRQTTGQNETEPLLILPAVSPLRGYGVVDSNTEGPLLIHRRLSVNKSNNINYRGTSTFGQTLFNAIAILVGIGMLSEPLAFAYAGWIGGSILLVSYALAACYTAILLANIMFSDHRVKTYADVGRKAFGLWSVPLTSVLFCLELFSLSVVLVTLFADSLHAVKPVVSLQTLKILSLFVILPTIILPISLLAYTSVIGILSSLLIILVIFYDGVTKPTSPGSLSQPSPTDLIPLWDSRKLGMAFGLFMAGFSGHAVVPSLARDMKDPAQFGIMIKWAFAISTIIYASVGAAGYLMFGSAVTDEISQDLLRTIGYNPVLNEVLMWMLVIMPISKFALGTRPLHTSVETMLGIEHQRSGTFDHLWIARLCTRFLLAGMSVTVSILIPNFSAMMSFLGSFSAFTICIIGPILAHIQLNGGKWWDKVALGVAMIMAVWGTVVSFA